MCPVLFVQQLPIHVKARGFFAARYLSRIISIKPPVKTKQEMNKNKQSKEKGACVPADGSFPLIPFSGVSAATDSYELFLVSLDVDSGDINWVWQSEANATAYGSGGVVLAEDGSPIVGGIAFGNQFNLTSDYWVVSEIKGVVRC